MTRTFPCSPPPSRPPAHGTRWRCRYPPKRVARARWCTPTLPDFRRSSLTSSSSRSWVTTTRWGTSLPRPNTITITFTHDHVAHSHTRECIQCGSLRSVAWARTCRPNTGNRRLPPPTPALVNPQNQGRPFLPRDARHTYEYCVPSIQPVAQLCTRHSDRPRVRAPTGPATRTPEH
jgi:hypothetical protein